MIAGGRQGLGISVSDFVMALILVADEACEAHTRLEQLSHLSYCFTMERNGIGPKQTLMSLSVLELCFTSFLCKLMCLWGTFDLFFLKPW